MLMLILNISSQKQRNMIYYDFFKMSFFAALRRKNASKNLVMTHFIRIYAQRRVVTSFYSVTFTGVISLF